MDCIWSLYCSPMLVNSCDEHQTEDSCKDWTGPTGRLKDLNRITMSDTKDHYFAAPLWPQHLIDSTECTSWLPVSM